MKVNKYNTIEYLSNELIENERYKEQKEKIAHKRNVKNDTFKNENIN